MSGSSTSSELSLALLPRLSRVIIGIAREDRFLSGEQARKGCSSIYKSESGWFGQITTKGMPKISQTTPNNPVARAAALLYNVIRVPRLEAA
jgi:hypothetical protein